MSEMGDQMDRDWLRKIVRTLKRQCHKCGKKVSCYCKLRPLGHEVHGLVLVCKPCLQELEATDK